MERMLRMNKDNSEYEIDRELTGKFAIESNAELQDRVEELEEENRKLKEDNRFLTKISKEYMEKENIIEVTEFTQLYKDDLEKENENLKAIIDHYKKFEEGKNKLKEVYIKNTAEFLDKKFPKINGFIEEDTLQELRDLGKI